MDEPFAALDAITRDVLHEELTAVWQDTGMTVVFVTHNVREAVRLGQRVALMSSRPGRFVRTWDVDIAGPRRIESPEVAALALEITESLRREIRRHAGSAAMSTPAIGDVASARGRPRRPGHPPGPQVSRRARARRSVLPPVVALVVFLAAWATVAASGITPPATLPAPADVWHTLARSWNDGSDAGGDRGLAASRRRRVRALGRAGNRARGAARRSGAAAHGVGPLVSGLQSLPSATWLPVAVLWFGVSDAAVYTVVLAGAIPSIAARARSPASMPVPPLYLRVGHVLGASRVESLRYVVLPAALPGYLPVCGSAGRSRGARSWPPSSSWPPPDRRRRWVSCSTSAAATVT